MLSAVWLYQKIRSCYGAGVKIAGMCMGFLMICSVPPGHGEPVRQLPAGAKIVVIGGALTEIVYALDAQGQLVGRDSTSIYPSAAQSVKNVGYMRALSAEGVLSLAPGGILLAEGSGPPETLDILEKASVPMVVVPEGFDRRSVLEKIRVVGGALHREKQADMLAREVDRQFALTDRMTSTITQKKHVLFVLSIQNGRIMAAGANTAANGMIKLAGAVNAITAYQGYKLLNDEAILEAAPDLVLFMSNAGAPMSAGALLANPAIAMTPAGKAHAFYQMDGLFLLGFGPRTASAAKMLAESLYPELKGMDGERQ